MEAAERTANFRNDFNRVKDEVSKMIVGQEEIIDGVLICLFANGHVLLEGVPGLGKTLLVRTLSEALSLKFSRIQFTPDLMPADIIGTNVVNEDASGNRYFQFTPGPVFCNILLADEINRATPKTQSALLEAMQEHIVTVSGTTHTLEEPFFVLATQNPLEMEGTYPLPEAQLDRFFFKLVVRYPSQAELITILERTTDAEVIQTEPVLDGHAINTWRSMVREVPIAPHVRDYAVRLILATHPQNEHAPGITNQYVRYGASPRAAQALMLAGKIHALLDARYNVSFNDIKIATLPALRHRIILNFEGEAEGIETDTIIEKILQEVPTEK